MFGEIANAIPTYYYMSILSWGTSHLTPHVTAHDSVIITVCYQLETLVESLSLIFLSLCNCQSKYLFSTRLAAFLQSNRWNCPSCCPSTPLLQQESCCASKPQVCCASKPLGTNDQNELYHIPLLYYRVLSDRKGSFLLQGLYQPYLPNRSARGIPSTSQLYCIRPMTGGFDWRL